MFKHKSSLGGQFILKLYQIICRRYFPHCFPWTRHHDANSWPNKSALVFKQPSLEEEEDVRQRRVCSLLAACVLLQELSFTAQFTPPATYGEVILTVRFMKFLMMTMINAFCDVIQV